MTLSSTQTAILAAAAQHSDRLASPPTKLAPAPREAVRRSVLAKGLIEPATLLETDAATAWPADGARVAYRITEAGLAAIGRTGGKAAHTGPGAPRSTYQHSIMPPPRKILAPPAMAGPA